MKDLRIEFGNVMEEVIGPENGLGRAKIEDWAVKLSEVARKVQKKKESGELGFMLLPHEEESMIPSLEKFADEARKKFDNFVVVGIGGSSLGPKALLSGLGHPFYNLLGKNGRKERPRIFFPDNVDPELVAGLLDTLDLSRTLFNIVSKSGGTVETAANFIVIHELLSKELDSRQVREHLVITTDPREGVLRKLARDSQIAAFNIPPGVGGRFSVLTPVGLLPAAMAGLDLRGLLAGARRLDELCRSESVRENPALLSAFFNSWFDLERGRNILVTMPYSQRLWDLADWFRQLWAESLGKEKQEGEKVIGVGSTPVRALGATDQHSQVQLYMEGPQDKLLVFLRVEEFSRRVPLHVSSLKMEGIDYLDGKTLSQLLLAEQSATAAALAAKKRPNYTIVVPELNSFTMGQLIYLMEMMTAYAGEIYQVNAFNQPGVEMGKKLARGLMGKEGSEEEKRWVENLLSRGKGFVCP